MEIILHIKKNSMFSFKTKIYENILHVNIFLR